MPSIVLKNKPLVEAIFEIRWGQGADPDSKLLPGLIYAEIKNDYPIFEELTAGMSLPPGVVIPGLIQQRFRASPNSWPLVQIGPGIITVNDTKGYVWDDFRSKIMATVQSIFKVHPKSQDLRVSNLNLRYIDGIDLDPSKQDVFEFLRTKLKVDFKLSEAIFKTGAVTNSAEGFSCQTVLRCSRPAANLSLSFAMGVRDSKPTLFWDTQIFSQGDQIPEVPSKMGLWLDEAHSVTHDCFMSLIEGDLFSQFS